MDQKYLVPAGLGRITDPAVGEDLPAEGRWVDYTAYWAGKLAHGDVTERDPPAPPVDEAEQVNPAQTEAAKDAPRGDATAAPTDPPATNIPTPRLTLKSAL